MIVRTQVRLQTRCLVVATALFSAQAWAQNPPAGSDSDLDAMLGTVQSDPTPAPAPATAAEASSTEPAAAPEQEAEAPPQATLATVPVETLPADEAEPTKRKAPRNALIEEIVVTAQKRSESINDVPISISAFSGDALKQLGVTDTRDLGNLVPGFMASDSGYNTPVYTLRGVGFNDTTYTATSTVGVYVDEVNLPYSIMTKGAALDLERVEVLKGPQGILYGRNTTGGAINYIAKKPTDTFESGITATLGRFTTTDVEGFASGPFTDTLKGRLAVKDVRSQQGSQYSQTRPDDHLGKIDKQSFRGALEWQAQEALSFRLVGEGWSDRSEPRAPQVIFKQEQNGNDPAGMFFPPQARAYPTIPQHGADPQVADWSPQSAGGLDWQLDDNFLLAALRSDWQLSDARRFTSLLSQMRVASDGSKIPQSGYNFNNAEQIIDAHIKTTALELRFSGESGVDQWFDWMVGGNASRDDGFENHIELVDNQSALFSDAATGQSISNRLFVRGSSLVTQLAGFFNLGFRFNEALKLSTGARFTQQTQKYAGCSGDDPDTVGRVPGVTLGDAFPALSAQQAAAYTAATGMPGVVETSYTPGDCFSIAENGSFDEFKDTLDEDNLSFRLALDYKPIDDYLFYASLGRGFKAGGYPVLTAARQDQFKPVTQEQLDAAELGAKTSFFDGQLHTNTALYYYRYKDKQLLTKANDQIFGPLPVLRNAPKSRVLGAELDVQYVPAFVEGLFLSATAAYTDTKVLEFQSLDADGQPFDFAGRPFNFAPKLQYTLLFNYQRPLTDRLQIKLGADYYRSGATNSTLDQDPRYAHDAYGLIGARVGVADADDTWSLTAAARNLANEFYTVSVYRNGDAISRIAGAPRTYSLSLGYNFR